MKRRALRTATVLAGCAGALALSGLSLLLDLRTRWTEHDRRPLQREDAWQDVP